MASSMRSAPRLRRYVRSMGWLWAFRGKRGRTTGGWAAERSIRSTGMSWGTTEYGAEEEIHGVAETSA